MPNYNPNSIWGSKEKQYTYGSENSPAKKGSDLPPQIPQDDDGPSFFHRHGLIFFTIGLLLALGLVGLVVYLLLPASAPNIAITFSEPDSIIVGDPFPFTVTVSNKSNSVLQNAQMSIVLPGGVSFAGEDPSQRVMTEPIGTLSSKSINPPQMMNLIVTGNPGTSQTINIKLTYQTAATAATQFETDANTAITIGSQSVMSLTYSAPSGIFSGQNFDLAVNYANNTAHTLNGVQLKMQYPPAYNFSKSTTTTPVSSGNNTWNIGTIAPNATGTLIITGDIVGPQNAQYQLNGTLSANFSGQNYPIITAPANFAVTTSPLSLSLTLNNSSTYVAGLSDNLNYTLTYTNNSQITFQTVNITAALTGQMYDLTSLKTNGAFNSQTNTITWYAANTPALLSLAPGQSGSVTFTVNTKAAFPIRLPSNENYTLGVTAQIQSPTVPPNTAGTNTTSLISLTNKMGGKIVIAAKALIKDTATGIVNSGPYPPKVNQPTQYTIHWDITNYSTDAKSVTVSAYLQSGTTFTGKIKTNLGSSTPVYSEATGLITWTIPLIPATTGVIGNPVEAIFQVSNTPAINQVGQTVTLMGPTTLTATDAFTGSSLQSTASPLSTQFLDDPSAGGQPGTVTQ
jgi:uncharacterized repeat protein (TIGR01451 family)